MWITDGINNKRIGKLDNIPEGWYKGRVNVHTEASRRLLSEKVKESLTDEVKAKRNATLLARYGSLIPKNLIPGAIAYQNKKRELDKLKPFDEKGVILKRLQISEDQNGKCLHCSLDHWLGNQIKLELDHIDGNNKNNSRDNLRLLCPNCHSFTDTWRKKKNKVH